MDLSTSKVTKKRRLGCSRDCGGSAVLCVLISVLGIGIAATLLGIDIPQQHEAQINKFRKVADEANLRMKSALNDYEVSSLWLHQACRDRRMSFSEFRGVYQYITWTGLEFLQVSCGINVSQSERQYDEKQSEAYLTSHYPSFYYRYAGFHGFEFNRKTGDYELGLLSNKSHYYVTHFVEPLDDINNLRAVDFDISTGQSRGDIALEAIATGNFSATTRLNNTLDEDSASQTREYKIIMAHPGLPLGDDESGQGSQDNDTAIMVVLISAILQRAYVDCRMDEDTLIYMFDSTDSTSNEEREPEFLGGAKIGRTSYSLLPEVEWTAVENTETPTGLMVNTEISFATRRWTLVIIAPPGSYQPNHFLSIFGALMIVIASMCASLWVYTRSKAKSEKAMILLTAAKSAAQGERELNDYIAHE